MLRLTLRRVAVGLPIVVLVLSGPLSSVRAQQTMIVEQVLVRVNGDLVTKTQFESRQIDALRERPEFAEAPPTGEALQKAVAEATPELILDAVDELLLVQRAKELGASTSDQQFNQWITGVREDNNLQDEEKFKEALRQMGMTIEQLKQTFERRRLVNYVQQTEVASRISVTEEEARAFYEANRRLFSTPSEITMRELFLEVPASDRGFNVAQDEVVRARAEDLRRRALAGESFDSLAAEASPIRAISRRMESLNRDDIAPQFQAIIDGMQVGGVSEVQRATRGYQIFQLEARTASTTRPFQDVRADVSRRVQEQKAGREMFGYLERLRAQANIVWRNDELKRAYDHALDQRRAAAASASGA